MSPNAFSFRIQNLISQQIHRIILKLSISGIMKKGSFSNYVYKTRYVGFTKTTTFCQRSCHRICQHSGGQKKPKSCQRSLWTTPKQKSWVCRLVLISLVIHSSLKSKFYISWKILKKLLRKNSTIYFEINLMNILISLDITYEHSNATLSTFDPIVITDFVSDRQNNFL